MSMEDFYWLGGLSCTSARFADWLVQECHYLWTTDHGLADHRSWNLT